MRKINTGANQFLSKKIKDRYNILASYREKRYITYFDGKGKVFLGLGIGDGKLTLKVAKKIKAEKILGIDLDKDRLSKAKRKGIETYVSDLNKMFPISDSSVDVIGADQVIEHLQNPDLFISETYRVLKKGGYAVICTENLSSWHNLLALSLGQQAFSQHISKNYFLGNKLSPNYKKRMPDIIPHQKIFTKQGLVDIMRQYGFRVEIFFGIGYFPIFSPRLSKLFEKIDPTHSYFIGVKIRKK